MDVGEALEAALTRFTHASRSHELARAAYRSKIIGDEEFLRARVEFMQAKQALDEAEEALIRAYPEAPWGKR